MKSRLNVNPEDQKTKSSLHVVLLDYIGEFEELIGPVRGTAVLGIDNIQDRPVIEFFKGLGANITLLRYDHHWRQLPVKENFDIVVTEGVVSKVQSINYYVQDPAEWFYSEVLRILKPSGHYISNDFLVEPVDLEKAGFVDVKKIISDSFLYGRKS
ncbi:hypothetical protein KY306_00875 [Candidatus Woesearchaeota archaeon]|nr:hypothetical protein [Candidatus Woesearchaeota archaeon]